MKSTIRRFCISGLVFGVCILSAPGAFAQGNSHKGEMKAERGVDKAGAKTEKTWDKAVQKGHDRRVSTRRRATSTRSRVLCEDGVVVTRTTNACAGHGGVAARQGSYSTYPPASNRARERANENSAVVRGIRANNVRAGAIARCKDGTYWHATSRTGACYRHGGVARWL
jgi:Protein of unknown function (DUF3761)